MENKKSKKKVLLYYLVLAACLLIIAAVTVAVVLTVGRNPSTLTSDGQQTEKPDDGKNPDDGKTPDDKPTGTDGKYGLPLKNASVSCGFVFTFDKTLIRFAVHRGIDFEGEAGDNVFAVKDGTITKIVTDHILSENYVTVKQSDGVTTTYKYIDAKAGLKVGDNVKKGDVLGTISAAGGYEMNEGPHLHLEMQVNGKPVDPDTYLEIAEK